MPFWKIPSGEVTNYPYLVALARTGKPVVMSTGMCEMTEIEAAINAEIDSVNKKLPVYKHIPNVEIRETEFEKNTTRKIIRYKIK